MCIYIHKTLGDSKGQKSLACCSCSWGHKESDVTNDSVTEQ